MAKTAKSQFFKEQTTSLFLIKITMQYIYETIQISYSIWTGKSKDDYLDIVNERGSLGWRFVGFTPLAARPKGVKGIELIFEKQY